MLYHIEFLVIIPQPGKRERAGLDGWHADLSWPAGPDGWHVDRRPDGWELEASIGGELRGPGLDGLHADGHVDRSEDWAHP